MDFNITIYDVMIVPVIIGLVEIFKIMGLPIKFSPVAAVVLGVIIGIAYLAPENLMKGILVGVAIGLSSVGLYSSVKNVKEGIIDAGSSTSGKEGTQ